MANESILEIARVFFTGISALATSIGVWQKSRDGKKAAKVFDESYTKIRNSSESRLAAQELIGLMPKDILESLERRAEHCWSGYKGVLEGGFLPNEVDEATESVKACICRELRRIKKLNGYLPVKWNEHWNYYECIQ